MENTEKQAPDPIVTKDDIKRALQRLGVVPGDILVVHSSFKSMGTIEGGAETVVGAMREVLGDEGTLVFPTLCQKDWGNVYQNWNVLTSPSDIGYLTNYFRLLPGAIRSDQATHSVAAMGKHAEYITRDHGKRGQRYGIYGETPFAVSSPWEKFYTLHAKILLLGVSYSATTLRHFVEYRLLNRYLQTLIGTPEEEKLKEQIWHYSTRQRPGVWPTLDNMKVVPHLEQLGFVQKTTCGNATLTLFPAFDYVNTMDCEMENDPDTWTPENFATWVKEVREVGHNGSRSFPYEAGLRRRFAEALPARIYDASFELDLSAPENEEEERFILATESMMGATLCGGLMSGKPFPDPKDFERLTEEGLARAEKQGWEFAMSFPVEVGYERAAAMLKAHPEIKALKPYHFDLFYPEWVFRLAEEAERPLILSIDPAEELGLFLDLYPQYSSVTAVLTLSEPLYREDETEEAIADLLPLKNVYLDCSKMKDPDRITDYHFTFGIERMIWGSGYESELPLSRAIGYPEMKTMLGIRELYADEEDIAYFQRLMADNAIALFR